MVEPQTPVFVAIRSIDSNTCWCIGRVCFPTPPYTWTTILSVNQLSTRFVNVFQYVNILTGISLDSDSPRCSVKYVRFLWGINAKHILSVSGINICYHNISVIVQMYVFTADCLGENRHWIRHINSLYHTHPHVVKDMQKEQYTVKYLMNYEGNIK